MHAFCFKVLGDGESDIILLASVRPYNLQQHPSDLTAFCSF